MLIVYLVYASSSDVISKSNVATMILAEGGHVFPQSHSRPMKGIVNIPEKERRRTMSFEAGAAAVFTALHGGISNDKNVCPSVCQTHEV